MKTDQKLRVELKTEWLDRVMEVAKAGNHSVLAITNDPKALYQKYGNSNLIAIKPCPCGNTNHPIKTCSCKPDEIIEWQKNFPETDLTLDVVITGENIVIKGNLDKQSLQLLESAIKQMVLSYSQLVSVLKVAETIAKMDGYAEIKANHIAEALQYRPKDSIL